MIDRLINIFQPEEIDETQLTSAFIICIQNNKILLGYNNWREQWEVPAGKRELGETIIETAKREFLEETHQNVSKIDLKMVVEIENGNQE